MNLEALLRSFTVATLATCLAGVLGVGAAALLTRRRSALGDLFDALLTAPMVLPPTVLGYALLRLLSRDGAFGSAWEQGVGAPLLFSPAAAVLAAAIAALPLVLRAARAAIEGVDPRLAAAAATLGATPARVLWSVVLPLARPGIVAGLTLGFARALGEFGITLMIAGNLPGATQTAALAIYDAVQAGRDAEAAGMATLLAALATALLLVATGLGRRRRDGF